MGELLIVVAVMLAAVAAVRLLLEMVSLGVQHLLLLCWCEHILQGECFVSLVVLPRASFLVVPSGVS